MRWLCHGVGPRQDVALCAVLFSAAITLGAAQSDSECFAVGANAIPQTDGYFSLQVEGKYDTIPVLALDPFPHSGGWWCPKAIEKKCVAVRTNDMFIANGNFAPDDGGPLRWVRRAHHVSQPGTFCESPNMHLADAMYEIGISPSWRSFAGFDLSAGRLSGAMNVEYFWFHLYETETGKDIKDIDFGAREAGSRLIGSPPRLVDLTNFDGSGTVSERPTHSSVVAAGIKQGNTLVVYSGSFFQKVDGNCAPFDTQEVQFDFRLPSPYDREVRFLLRCAPEDRHCKPTYVCSNLSDPSHCPKDLDTLTHTRFEGETANGYTWSALTCEKKHNTRHIVCTMQGRRVFSKAILNDVVPGIIMSVISFASFLLPTNMAMPRVATTMIALLTFVNKGSSVAAKFPSTGLSIVEEFYTVGVLVMLLNLLGHVVAFRYPQKSVIVNDLQLHATALSFVIFLAARLLSRSCQDASEATTAVLVISSILLALSILRSVKKYWAALKSMKDSVAKSRGRLDVVEASKEEPSAVQVIGSQVDSSILPGSDAGDGMSSRKPATSSQVGIEDV